jgi:uncharacterized membrane protein YciS (DUF1049 family)
MTRAKEEIMEQPKGFFGSLFDLSFTSFITSKLVKVLYVLAIVAVGLGAIGLVVAAFQSGTAQGVLALLVIAPLVFLLGVIWSRVVLELIVVIFRISENIAEIAQQGRKEVQPPQF